jgi:hypothetical protein
VHPRAGAVVGRPPPGGGRAVQVHPIKPVLKAPGSMLLKVRCDEPLSNVAFNFNLRCYSVGVASSEIFELDISSEAAAESKAGGLQTIKFSLRFGS